MGKLTDPPCPANETRLAWRNYSVLWPVDSSLIRGSGEPCQGFSPQMPAALRPCYFQLAFAHAATTASSTTQVFDGEVQFLVLDPELLHFAVLYREGLDATISQPAPHLNLEYWNRQRRSRMIFGPP